LKLCFRDSIPIWVVLQGKICLKKLNATIMYREFHRGAAFQGCHAGFRAGIPEDAHKCRYALNGLIPGAARSSIS
jgi:hypothetical protein